MGFLDHPGDIRLLPGSSVDLRAGAAAVRATLHDLDRARAAAVRIAEITGGEHWSGEAFEVFRAVVDRKPLPAALDHARSRMEQAAAGLDRLATAFDSDQQTLRWCRHRLAGLRDAAGSASDELRAEIEAEMRAVLRDADDAWSNHRRSLSELADLYDWLDDQPTYAKPPPSALERIGGAVGSFVIGVGEGTWDMVTGVAELAMLLNPVMLPFTIHDAIENRDQIMAVLQYAWDNPGEFLTELGKSMLDWETLMDDPARWLGRRVPDILLTLATGGMGKVGTSAALSVRGFRGARTADTLTDALRITDRMAPAVALSRNADEAAGLLGSRGVMARLNRLGADPGRLARAGEAGAFARSDTVLGRLATRFDDAGGGATTVARQIPGRLNDEIRGVVSIPSRLVRGQFGGNVVVDRLTGPMSQAMTASHLTNGWTGRLGMIDGLLVGGPALSPATRNVMGGLLGFDLLDTMAGPLDTFRDVHAAAVEAGH